jgi:hypothetical protein
MGLMVNQKMFGSKRLYPFSQGLTQTCRTRLLLATPVPSKRCLRLYRQGRSRRAVRPTSHPSAPPMSLPPWPDKPVSAAFSGEATGASSSVLLLPYADDLVFFQFFYKLLTGLVCNERCVVQGYKAGSNQFVSCVVCVYRNREKLHCLHCSGCQFSS